MQNGSGCLSDVMSCMPVETGSDCPVCQNEVETIANWSSVHAHNSSTWYFISLLMHELIDCT